MIDVKNMRDYTEKVWFLGTDTLEEEKDDSDLRLMDKHLVAHSYSEGVGTFFRVPPDDYYENFLVELEAAGYSPRFISIIKEAHRRGYMWIYFHPDIETEDVSKLSDKKLTGLELQKRYSDLDRDEHSHLFVEDWMNEVDNDDTRRGYWEWVAATLEECSGSE